VAFDPKAYLSDQSASQDKFDPVAYLSDQSQGIKRDYPIRRMVSKYLVRPLVEGGAMTLGAGAGAAVASPAGPIASGLAGVVGGAAMYPPAHEAVNRLDELLGISGMQKPVGDLEKTLGEFQTGLGIEMGGKVLGSAVRKGAETLVRGGVPTLLGPSKEAVAARLERPVSIKGAPTYQMQAERLPKVLGNISRAISSAYDKASSLLRNSPNPEEGAVPVSQLTGILNGLQEKLKVGATTVGASDKAATQKVLSLMGDLNDIIKRPTPAPILGPTGQPIMLRQAEAYIPETTFQKVIQRIRKDINFDDKSADVTNSILTDVSAQLDSLLKTGNDTYRRAMKPVSVLTRLYNDAAEKFALTKRTDEGLQPTDTTISSMKTLPQERRGMSQQIMKRIKVATGEDFTQKSKDRALAEQFSGSNAQGSRRTLGGATIGSAVGALLGHLVGAPGEGGTVGSMVGGLAGMATDTSGREVAAKIIDSYLRAKPYLANLPYNVLVRLVSSGALGNNP